MNDVYNLMRWTRVDNAETFAKLAKVILGSEKLQKLDNVIPETFINGRITLVLEDSEGSEGAYMYIGNPVRSQDEVNNIVPVPMGDNHMCICVLMVTPDLGMSDIKKALEESRVI